MLTGAINALEVMARVPQATPEPVSQVAAAG